MKKNEEKGARYKLRTKLLALWLKGFGGMLMNWWEASGEQAISMDMIIVEKGVGYHHKLRAEKFLHVSCLQFT